MKLFVWVKPAWIPSNWKIKPRLLDHTWVTSYDLSTANYSNIEDVINANEHYWFCYGNFYQQGELILTANSTLTLATCLVQSNNSPKIWNGTRGQWYGIHGVCHQVSNRVLCTTPISVNKNIVRKAKGYLLSSALYGVYGLDNEWVKTCSKCSVVPQHQRKYSLLQIRMAYRILHISINNPRIIELEKRRLQLLKELDEIGYATKESNETVEIRVEKMNARINDFLNFAANNSFDDDISFMKMFGIEREEEVFLIDPAFFEFPVPQADDENR